MPGFYINDLKRDKLAIFLSVVAAIGWIVFVAGFGKHEHDENGMHFKLSSNAFPFWGLSLAGLPGLLLHLVYGCTQRRGIGTLALLINIFMLVCCGGILNETGTRIQQCLTEGGKGSCVLTTHSTSNSNNDLFVGNATTAAPVISMDVQPYEQAEFAGAFIYTFCQTMTILLFFYRMHGVEGYSTV